MNDKRNSLLPFTRTLCAAVMLIFPICCLLRSNGDVFYISGAVSVCVAAIAYFAITRYTLGRYIRLFNWLSCDMLDSFKNEKTIPSQFQLYLFLSKTHII